MSLEEKGRISFLIPAYNEAGRIGHLLDEICNLISGNSLDAEIIVAIDGNDGTENIVRQYAAKYPFIKYTLNGGRNGKGAAIKRCMHLIRGNIVVLMDADNSVELSEIMRISNYLNSSDVVIANRYRLRNNIPVLRRILSYWFNILVRASLGIRVRDTQSGYKLCRREAFMEGMRRVGVTNTFFDVSFLYHLKLMKKKVVEIPVKYRYDKGSTFSPAGEVVGQGISLLSFRIRHSRFNRYVPLSLRTLYMRKFRWI